MGQRAAIWVRVSTDEQDVENQLRDLRSWAEHRGLDVVQTYELEDTSAWTGAHRERLNEALEDARHGEYEVLLVWALDRLSREGIEPMLKVMRQFRERGVLVLSHSESWTDGPPEFQELLTAFFAWVAQQESARLSKRIKAGLAKKAARGERIGRQPGAKDAKPRKKSGYYQRWERERATKPS
ncbi:MAG TPA: recombinase family protein [Acidimicrobiales bacterium]|nr:recombinase family protein [Acidimicrobiales bacterium]